MKKTVAPTRSEISRPWGLARLAAFLLLLVLTAWPEPLAALSDHHAGFTVRVKGERNVNARSGG